MRNTARRDIQVRVRMSRNELDVLNILARREGRNWSEMLRQAVREAAERRGLPAVGLIGARDLLEGKQEAK